MTTTNPHLGACSVVYSADPFHTPSPPGHRHDTTTRTSVENVISGMHTKYVYRRERERETATDKVVKNTQTTGSVHSIA